MNVLPNLSFLDVVEVDVMRRGVDDGEQQHRVGELSVHPEILVERDELDLGTNPSHDCPADRQEDEHAIAAEDETGASRQPDGVLQCI